MRSRTGRRPLGSGPRCPTPWSRWTRCTRTRGKKGTLHPDPADPPRRRANKAKGHGTWDRDRPPVFGIVGRDSGQVRLEVARRNNRATLCPLAQRYTQPGTTVNSDEWVAYDPLPACGRPRVKVKHSRPNPEYARDDDGDGIREVHANTIEGLWTGLRNFLRPFRGVNKVFLAGYVALFQWAHNLKTVSAAFLRALMTHRCTRYGT
jgi:transposase-like protein